MKCPSCGMEIPDDVEICPYCTANVKKRVRIKAIYVVALTLIIVSATYAIFAYTQSGVEISKIGSLSINENYNFVHVRGVVVSYPRTYDSNYGVTQLSFTIDDGTGQITVKIYRDLIPRVVEEHKVPGIGDVVDAQGTFSYGTRKSLTINNVDFLNIEKGKYRGVNLKDVAMASPWDFKNGELIYVEGNITSVKEYSFGYISSIDDSVDLLIPHAYTSLALVNLSKLGSGIARIYGSLEFYQPKDHSSDYIAVNMSEVMKDPEEYNKTNVFVEWAQVVDKDEDNSTIMVNDNGTNVTVYSSYGVKYYDVGDYVQIQGKFVNYHGIWEISVTRKNDYITEPRWEIIMSSQYKIIEEKSYGSDMSVYSLVELKGVVADYRTLSYGYLVTLWANNQSYDVYIENENSVNGHLDYGSNLVVKGMVTLYNGEKEIKVRAYTLDSVEVVS